MDLNGGKDEDSKPQLPTDVAATVDGGVVQEADGQLHQASTDVNKFMELFFVDPTSRKPTRPTPPATSWPISRDGAAEDNYEDADGTTYSFTPESGLSRVATEPLSSKRMKTAPAPAKTLARNCNAQIGSTGTGRSTEMLPIPSAEIQEKQFVILRSASFNLASM